MLIEIIDKNDLLLEAAQHGNLSRVKELVGTTPPEAALRAACRAGHIDIVWYLLKHGADLHHDCELPLKWAVTYNRIEIAELLLRRGADVHSDREHALAIAVQHHHVYMIEFLLSWGATPNELTVRTAHHFGSYALAKRFERMMKGVLSEQSQP